MPHGQRAAKRVVTQIKVLKTGKVLELTLHPGVQGQAVMGKVQRPEVRQCIECLGQGLKVVGVERKYLQIGKVGQEVALVWGKAAIVEPQQAYMAQGAA